MTAMTSRVGTVRETRRVEILDLMSVLFGRTLRAAGVAASPAEVIEVRRTLAIVGAADLALLRAALRSVCVKYAYEAAPFDRAFDFFFGAAEDPGGPCLLYTSPSPRDATLSRMPSSA